MPPGATSQVNRKTAHNGIKVLVVIMLKRLTDPSIPVLNKLQKLTKPSDKIKETDLQVGL